MDWDSLWGGLQESVSKSVSDLVAVGKPALTAAVEQQAINWLTDQQKQTTAELNANVKDLASRPTDPNSLGAQLSGVFQGAALNTYGLYIVGGIAALLVAGMLLRK